MVLEDASTPNEDFASESSPSSDLDPYASSGSEYGESRPSSYLRVTDNNPPLYVNGSQLPFPLWQPKNGDPSRFYQVIEKLSRNVIAGIEKNIRRPVKQEEADAVVFSLAKSFRIGSYGQPLGLIAAAVQFTRTMKRFRFPFYTPFKEGSRLSPDRFGPFRGASARWAWHTARGASYGLVGSYMGQIVLNSYGISSGMAARAMDPRLKDLNNALTRNMKEKQDQALESTNKRREDTGRADQRSESVEMWRKRKQAEAEELRRRQSGRVDSSRAVDDMSPTGGAYDEELRMESDGFVKDDYQTLQPQSDSQPWQDYTDSGAGQTSSGTANPPPSTPQRQSTSTQPRPYSPKSSSAWDRLRKDAMSSGNQSNSPSSRSSTPNTGSSSQSRSSSSGNDSFSFSRDEEDSQLAKSEAQKDFDSRLERERSGKDFNESGGQGGKRW